ncbi:alcohol dehydrogenase family protein [Striga asiatica]|uniref:Alcohol dehydrogenase family protein n=1 Tax=Striga asiatica TaxID=4170 RepID=A0A5A7RHK3_STRAF|nr:alcohol dehydrogenase family protein [Striga asiatica]
MPSTGVIKCRAAVAWAAGEPLSIEEVELSPPQPMEIRIQVVSTSLCRSDLSAWLSQMHTCRIVESVGQGVTEFGEGDHVLTLFTGECMSCRQCVSGKSNICQVLGLERQGVMHSDKRTRFSIKGKPVYHYCAVSSFSEYTVVHSGCAVKISPTAPLEKICLLSCGVAAGLGAAWKVANISQGSTVVVFGLGTVGLSVVQGAKLRGASRIIGVDTNPEKSVKGTVILCSVDDTAMAFGVTDFLNPNDHDQPIHQVFTRIPDLMLSNCKSKFCVFECRLQVINHITDGGADYAFECVGDTGMVTTALQCCCSGWGLTVTLGVPKEKPEIAAHYGLFLTGRTLTGSLFGGWKPKSDLPSLVDKYLKKRAIGWNVNCISDQGNTYVPVADLIITYLQEIEIDGYITHNLEFEDITKAFELMREGKCLRCVEDVIIP